MNRDIQLGRLKQMKGEARQQWARLNYDELEEIAGGYDRLVGRIQEKYGRAREGIARPLSRLLNSAR